MRILFAGTCAKELERLEANEDAFAFSFDRRCVVLSDGASESYDSQLWARLLVDKFAINPQFDEDWIESVVADYHRAHDLAAMRWSQQLAFERGCFATVLAVTHDAANQRLSLFGVGDSVAVLLMGEEIVRAWPLDHPDSFKERPTLLSTIRSHNKFTLAPDFASLSRMELDLTMFPEPTLLCMTDAIGEWALRMKGDDPERLADLLAIRSEEQLRSLVVAERERKRMRIDDSTLVILKFDAGVDADGLPDS